MSDVLFAVTHLLYVLGTGRVCTGEMSSSETLRRISSREGQNTKPSLVSSTSESRHQYDEPVFGNISLCFVTIFVLNDL